MMTRKVVFLLVYALATGKSSTAEQKVERVIQSGHAAMVRCVAMTPDGKYYVTGDDRGVAILWETATGRQIRTFAREFAGDVRSGLITDIAISDDGRRIVAGISSGDAYVWDARTGGQLQTFLAHKKWLQGVAISANGKRVGTCSSDTTAMLWDVKSGKQLQVFRGHTQRVFGVSLGETGDLVATASDDGTAAIWDGKTGKRKAVFRGHRGAVHRAVLTMSDGMLVTGGLDGNVIFWNIKTEKESFRHSTKNRVSRMDVGRGKFVVSASFDRVPQICDWITGKRKPLDGIERGMVLDVAMSADGKRVVAVGDHSVVVWNGASRKVLHSHINRAFGIGYFQVTQLGKRVLAGAPLNSVLVYDKGKLVRRIAVDSGSRLTTLGGADVVAASANGERLLVAGIDTKVRSYDCDNGKLLHTYLLKKSGGLSPMILDLNLSADGARALVFATSLEELAMREQTAVWEISTGKTMLGTKGDLAGSAISADGKLVAISTKAETILQEAESGKVVRKIDRGGWQVRFSPDGRHLLCISRKDAFVLDVANGKTRSRFREHQSEITSSCISPDGKLVVTVSRKGVAKIWEIGTGKRRASFSIGKRIKSVCLVNDVVCSVSASDDLVRFWDVTSGKPIAELFTMAGSRWILVTPDGRFDGSKDAASLVAHRVVGTNRLLKKVESPALKQVPGLLHRILNR